MGNDGGSIPDRRDLVRNKPKAEQADKANQTRARWFFCALSKRKLQEPIVSCALGKLYNKDSIIEYLLDKSAYGDGEDICGHIRSLKDVKNLKLTPNPSPSTSTSHNDERPQFACPLTMKEMNGAQPFVYISKCGDVFSQAGLRAVSNSPPSSSESPPPHEDDARDRSKQLDVCPQCATKYDKSTDTRTINPSPDEEETMYTAMLLSRSSEPKSSKSKKRKLEPSSTDSSSTPPSKKPQPQALSISSNSALAAEIVKGEAKRKAGMSEAVKSLYGSKDGVKRKETFMTMGTFTRYA